MEGAERVRLNRSYVDAVRGAGLVPLILPPIDPAGVDAVLAVVQGVVLTGGEDVDPATYGASMHPRGQTPHHARDTCELAAIRRARELRLPTLGICRGIQTINVALGGTLIQDIPSERPSDLVHDQDGDRDVRVHAVDIEPGSKLANALQATRIEVNSYHHQAVDRAAPGVRVTARSPDALVEGIEWPGDDWWMLAVQWHPEDLIADSRHDWDRGLFRAFARAVSGKP
jgi:putative glutamine amidotransferase